MKIVHINYSDSGGGPGRAAYRLHQALLNDQQDSSMLVIEKKAEDHSVFAIDQQNFIDRGVRQRLANFIEFYYIHSNRVDPKGCVYGMGYKGYDISTHSLVKEADIINLYWLTFFVSNKSLARISQLNKPVVWTLYDERPLTGGCHWVENCKKFTTDCRKCPKLKYDPFDTAYLDLIDKKNYLDRANLTIVTPSKWLADAARKSFLFKNSRIETIPSSVDTSIFYPRNKEHSKKALGLKNDVVVILFGCYSLYDKHKGFSCYLSAVKQMLKNEEIARLVTSKKLVFGVAGKGTDNINTYNLPIKSFGYADNNEKLATLYSASDILVLPSLEDNLPLLMLECMACGTPIVAFGTGGIPEVVRNGINGFVVPKRDVNSLSQRLKELVYDRDKRIKFGKRSAELIKSDYSTATEAKKYQILYKDLLARSIGKNVQKSDAKIKSVFETRIFYLFAFSLAIKLAQKIKNIVKKSYEI